MEKEPIKKHRDYLVTFDKYRQTGWRTKEELDELLQEGKVNWFSTSVDGKMSTTHLSEKRSFANYERNNIRGEEDTPNTT